MHKWNIIIGRLANTIKEHIRALAMANILYKYGGMCLPITTVVFKDLYPLYTNGIKNKGCFVGESINRNITSMYLGTYVDRNIMGCVQGSKSIEDYIQKLELLNSRDYTNEIEFCGDINTLLYKLVQDNRMNIISGDKLGVKDEDNKDILLDDLLGDTFINFDTKTDCIIIPNSELLNRIKYGWFNRLSREQVLNARTILSKQLLLALTN